MKELQLSAKIRVEEQGKFHSLSYPTFTHLGKTEINSQIAGTLSPWTSSSILRILHAPLSYGQWEKTSDTFPHVGQKPTPCF